MASRTALLDAIRRAGEVLNDFGIRNRIKNGYTRVDPLQIAEDAGVAVMLQPLQKLLGAYVQVGRPGIMVNVERPVGLVHMTCAHELGHFFLNHEPSADFQIDYGHTGKLVEQQADLFAYSLLAPLWLIKQIAIRKKWEKQAFADPLVVYQLSLRLGTSFTSMVWTLARYNVLSADVARSLADLSPKQIKQQLLGQDRLTDSNSDVWLLDQSDQDTIIEPHANDAFLITLPDNAASGYVWNFDELSSQGFSAKPIFNDAATVSVERHFRPDSLVGSHVHASMIISRANGVSADEGQMAMSLVQHRPWEEPSLDDEHRRFRAEYERLFLGIDKTERQRRLDDARAIV